MIKNPNQTDRTAIDECTCGWLSELHIIRTLIHGVRVQCGICGGTYSTSENEAVYNSLLEELSLPKRDALVLRFDDKGEVDGEQ